MSEAIPFGDEPDFPSAASTAVIPFVGKEPEAPPPPVVPITERALTIEQLSMIFTSNCGVQLDGKTPVLFKRYGDYYPLEGATVGARRMVDAQGRGRTEVHARLSYGDESVNPADLKTHEPVVVIALE